MNKLFISLTTGLLISCHNRIDVTDGNDECRSITHIHNNVHLRFDMRSTDRPEAQPNTSNRNLSRRPISNEDNITETEVQETSEHCVERNGKPHGTHHGNQINARQGYETNPSLNHGEPRGTNHDRNEDGQVQGINDSGVEIIGEILQLSGEPRGNTSSTGMPMIVDPAVVDNASNRPNIHQAKRMRLSSQLKNTTFLEEAMNNPIVQLSPELKYSKAIVNTSYLPPVTNEMSDEKRRNVLADWKAHRELSIFEDKVLMSLNTYEDLPKLPYRESSAFNEKLMRLNRMRGRFKAKVLPSPHEKLPRIYRIEPIFTIEHPTIRFNMNSQEIAIAEAKYKDEIVAAEVELEAIKYITTGCVPQMRPDEKLLFEKYLKIVNDRRDMQDGYELSLNKTFIEHLKEEYPEFDIPESPPVMRDNNEEPASPPTINSETPSAMINTNNEAQVSTTIRSDSTAVILDNNEQAETPPTLRRNECRVYHPSSQNDMNSDSSISSDSSSSAGNNDNLASQNVINIDSSDSDMSIEVTTAPARARTKTIPDCNNTSNLELDGNNKNDFLPKEKQLDRFINSLMELVTCSISMDIFKDPAITPGGDVFERKSLFKWLELHNNSCPLTRQIIAQQQVNPCHTMKRLVELMKNEDITSEFLQELRSERNQVAPRPIQDKPSSTQELPPAIELTSKQLRKARRKKENRKIKKKLNKKITQHKDNLRNHGYYDTSNQKNNMPSRPSYSLMHSLQEGFSIVIYSRSHKVNLCPELCLHRNCAIRLVLPPEMCLIIHEGTMYSEAKSRDTPNSQADLRLFGYVWPMIQSNVGNRTSSSSDGVARTSGDRVHRENIHNRTCRYLYNGHEQCAHCKNAEILVDLRGIPKSSYAPGDRILGDIAELGWLIVRTSRVSEDMNESIRQISKLGQGWDGRWFPMDRNEPNRMMKYRPSTKYPSEWDQLYPAMFIRNLRENVIQKVLNKEKKNLYYNMIKWNLLKNAGPITHDEQPHTDYPPRLPM